MEGCVWGAFRKVWKIDHSLDCLESSFEVLMDYILEELRIGMWRRLRTRNVLQYYYGPCERVRWACPFWVYVKRLLETELLEVSSYSRCTWSFHFGSIFDETVACLGEKQGMLVSAESSSWDDGVYRRILRSVWKTRKENSYNNVSVSEVSQNQTYFWVRVQWEGF